MIFFCELWCSFIQKLKNYYLLDYGNDYLLEYENDYLLEYENDYSNTNTKYLTFAHPITKKSTPNN